MKKKKELHFEKKIIVIAILFVLLCVLGFFIFFYVKNHKKEDVAKYPIVNSLNQMESLTKEHCLDDICVKDLTINYIPAENKEEEMSIISAVLINKGTDTKDTCIKLKFYQYDESKTKDFSVCGFDLEPGKELPIETQHYDDDHDLIYSTNYFLELLSEEEKEKLLNRND